MRCVFSDSRSQPPSSIQCSHTIIPYKVASKTVSPRKLVVDNTLSGTRWNPYLWNTAIIFITKVIFTDIENSRGLGSLFSTKKKNIFAICEVAAYTCVQQGNST